MKSVQVVDTDFRVEMSDETVLTGQALVGKILFIRKGQGATLKIRIDGVEPDPDDPQIVLHRFSIQDSSGRWVNACEPDPVGRRLGFPIKGGFDASGMFDPRKPGFSLACTAGVEAKCVRWGYKPWKRAPGVISMTSLYNACLRMARADYCGNGRSYTRNGTRIDLYDIAGIQKPEQIDPMPFEAAWGPKGALCLRHTRIPQNGSLQDVIKACPRLQHAPNGQACDDSQPGALIFNRS